MSTVVNQSRRAFIGALGGLAATGLASARSKEDTSFEESWTNAKSDLGYSLWEYNEDSKFLLWRYAESNPDRTPESVDILNWWEHELLLDEAPDDSWTNPDTAIVDDMPITGDEYRVTASINVNRNGPYADMTEYLGSDDDREQLKHELGWAFGYAMQGSLQNLHEYRDSVRAIEEDSISEAVYKIKDDSSHQAEITLDNEALDRAARSFHYNRPKEFVQSDFYDLAKPLIEVTGQSD